MRRLPDRMRGLIALWYTMENSALLIVISLLMAAAAADAEPNSAASPLNIRPDTTGANLQRRMIWTPRDAKLSSNFVAFRKSFDLVKAPSIAMLHLFADARYLLWINGQYILRGPARFDAKGPEDDHIDAAAFLGAGKYTAVVLVLENVSNGAIQLHVPALTLRIDALPDGSEAPLLQTDATWKWFECYHSFIVN